MEATDPASFEQYAQNQGFLLYQAYLRPDKGEGEIEHVLKFEELRDYAVVYLNGQVVATYDASAQTEKAFSLPRVERPGKLQVLVESLGHNQNLDATGIFGDVYLDDKQVRSWVVRLLPIDGLTERGTTSNADGPAGIFRGTIQISGEAKSAYLNLQGFQHGLVYINGKSVGRYWQAGEHAPCLYVNKEYFSKGANSVIVVDFLGNETEGNGSFVSVCGQCSGDAADLSEDDKNKMPTWELVLIIVGGVAALAIIVTLIVFAVIKCKHKKPEQALVQSEETYNTE